MPRWRDIDLGNKVFQNLPETALTEATAVLENGWINEARGHNRFPGLEQIVTFPDDGNVYLSDLDGDLIAATTSGRVYRVDRTLEFNDVTGVPLSGGRPVVFTKTEDELILAAGGPMLRLRKTLTELLAAETEPTTHVAFIDGYVVYIEKGSARFFHSDPGQTRTFPALNVFAAESKQDLLNAVVVTPYRELLLCGEESIEQWERLPQGTVPFGRRWTTGDGLLEPYSLITANNGNYGLNENLEFVRFSGQVSQPISEDFRAVVEGIDETSFCWGSELFIQGQAFLLWQFPNATNVYGTTGITLIYEYRTGRWYYLYGWDAERGVPDRWPGYSIHKQWGRTFIGLKGGVGELKTDAYSVLGSPQRMLYRSAPISSWGESSIYELEMRAVRRAKSVEEKPAKIRLRAHKENGVPTKWIERTLGQGHSTSPVIINFGELGNSNIWQFEYEITDPGNINISGLRALVQSIQND